MPYLILIIGLIVAIFAFYRFMIVATPAQIKTFMRCVVAGIYLIIALYFALTGRVIIAIGILLLSLPFIFKYYRAKIKASHNKKTDDE